MIHSNHQFKHDLISSLNVSTWQDFSNSLAKTYFFYFPTIFNFPQSTLGGSGAEATEEEEGLGMSKHHQIVPATSPQMTLDLEVIAQQDLQ